MLARDLRMPVAELRARVGWAELLHWIAFYGWEASQVDPKRRRTKKTKDKEQVSDYFTNKLLPFLKNAGRKAKEQRRGVKGKRNG